MIKLSKSLLLLVVGLVLALPMQAGAAAAAPIVKAQSVPFQMEFDGKTLKLPEGQFVFILNNTSYVPLRFVSYALQKNVVWDGKTSSVTVSNPTKQQEVMLKEYLMNHAAPAGDPASAGGTALKLTPRAVSFTFDGKKKQLPAGQSGYIVNNTLYVPVRFMSEAVGIEIGWDQKNKKVSGQSAVYKEQLAQQGGNSPSTGKTDPAKPDGSASNGGSGAAGGGGGGGGSVGGGTVTEASIRSSATSQLNSLASSCERDLSALLDQYNAATNEDTRRSLLAQGLTKLDACKSSFESIVAGVEAQLTEHGFSTAMIAEFRTEFDARLARGYSQV